MPDAFWAVVGLGVALFGAGAVVWVRIRRLIDRLKAQMVQTAMKAVMDWAFVESEVEIAGKKVRKLTATPQFEGLITGMLPFVISKGMEWAKSNVKLKDVVPIALGGEGGFPAEALKMVPKEYRGLAALFGPYIKPFLARFAGGGADKKPAEEPHPFAAELK